MFEFVSANKMCRGRCLASPTAHPSGAVLVAPAQRKDGRKVFCVGVFLHAVDSGTYYLPPWRHPKGSVVCVLASMRQPGGTGQQKKAPTESRKLSARHSEELRAKRVQILVKH